MYDIVLPEKINCCSICRERNIYNWKKHYMDNHPDLVAYHINVQMLKAIKKLSKEMPQVW